MIWWHGKTCLWRGMFFYLNVLMLSSLGLVFYHSILKAVCFEFKNISPTSYCHTFILYFLAWFWVVKWYLIDLVSLRLRKSYIIIYTLENMNIVRTSFYVHVFLIYGIEKVGKTITFFWIVLWLWKSTIQVLMSLTLWLSLLKYDYNLWCWVLMLAIKRLMVSMRYH